MTAKQPWHDAPIHECRDGTRGPISPVNDGNPRDCSAEDLTHMGCCACGQRWHEESVAIVVQAWWSLGAYRGQQTALDDQRRDPRESY